MDDLRPQASRASETNSRSKEVDGPHHQVVQSGRGIYLLHGNTCVVEYLARCSDAANRHAFDHRGAAVEMFVATRVKAVVFSSVPYGEGTRSALHHSTR